MVNKYFVFVPAVEDIEAGCGKVSFESLDKAVRYAISLSTIIRQRDDFQRASEGKANLKISSNVAYYDDASGSFICSYKCDKGDVVTAKVFVEDNSIDLSKEIKNVFDNIVI